MAHPPEAVDTNYVNQGPAHNGSQGKAVTLLSLDAQAHVRGKTGPQNITAGLPAMKQTQKTCPQLGSGPTHLQECRVQTVITKGRYREAVVVLA